MTDRLVLFISYLGISTLLLFSLACESEAPDEIPVEGPEIVPGFPEYITPTRKYYDLRIGPVPEVGPEAYRLKISGAVRRPVSFSLQELSELAMFSKTLTIECIGNSANGSLMGTANWKGFRVYDLLNSLGISEGVLTVKYISADGYYTFNTLDELKYGGVLGALYMNDEPIPPLFGFPLRIIFPGYYGVRQPGWVEEIEVLESGPEDLYSDSGWKSDSSMSIDSKIFFPLTYSSYTVGDSIPIGGAAFGAKRIDKVDWTLDHGLTWMPGKIIRSEDQDYTWVFWEAWYIPQSAGSLTLHSRATSADGRIQPAEDEVYLDGTNSWPSVTFTVSEGN